MCVAQAIMKIDKEIAGKGHRWVKTSSVPEILNEACVRSRGFWSS